MWTRGQGKLRGGQGLGFRVWGLGFRANIEADLNLWMFWIAKPRLAGK